MGPGPRDEVDRALSRCSRLPPKTDQNHGFLDMIGWGWKVDRKLALFMLINMGVLGFRVGA